jgi:putative ABC transport system substrate-binding protein
LGYLGADTRENQAGRVEIMRLGLAEHGYVEGHNLVVEQRFAGGDRDRLAALAAELVTLHPDVLIALNSVAALALMAVTSTIPIVATSGDAVGAGLVASLARPGGKVTGTSNLSRELSGERLQLLTDVVPGLSRVAVLWYAGGPAPERAFRETEAAAQKLGVDLVSLAVRGPQEFNSAWATALREEAQALLQIQGPVISTNWRPVVDFTTQRGLPTMLAARPLVVAGGLMAYAPNLDEQDRRVAYYLDRLLKGAKPADLPIEQPTTFDFIINLQTAQALGLTIPPHVLLQATEVLQ